MSSYVSRELIQIPVVRNGGILSLIHHEGEVCPAEQLGFCFARTQSQLCQFRSKSLIRVQRHERPLDVMENKRRDILFSDWMKSAPEFADSKK